MIRRKKASAIPRQKHCIFCVHSVKAIDYKNPDALKRFTSSYAKVVPRRKSGVCAKHQRMLSQAIKRARQMALMAFVAK